MNKRVLALMPHPDDIEFLCSGTLMRLRDLGCELHLATMTPGDKGSVELGCDEIAAVRRAEAERAAQIIGASSYTCLEFRDLEITFCNEARRRVAGLFRKVNPEIVFTTPPADYMFDHEITSQLVRDACFNASVKNYPADGEFAPTSGVPYLFYSDPIGGHDIFGTPGKLHFLVDVSQQIEAKAEALASHDSQRAWLRKQHGLDDYIDSMRRWAQSRGALAGFEYAEGFCQHLGHAHPEDNPLITTLGAHELAG